MTKEYEIKEIESREGSYEDFNSQDAFCDDLSTGEGPPEIEILGMELLIDGEGGSSLSGLDDSDNDSEARRFPPTVDSLELARERLPHLIVRPGAPRRRRRSPVEGKLTRFRNGEVDSLILTRRNKPHLVHRRDEHIDTMMKRLEDGRGLMDEVDSLILARRRLPHLIHVRERPKARTTHAGKKAEMVQNEYYQLLNDDDDSSSTSTTESLSSFDSHFTSLTVDSLVLARKRLGMDPPEEEAESSEEDSVAE
eukprot:CAMPEP_0176079684 /NCGR_PEP_ID=MMETSP0120_2-20121206/39854_1 /TAXON_ID=160619 /ORGANISM="Kryptoperidinium foliaceum, Strain CCMP 1326" /LENGTH=251 /DNA_ID=CAMNT_0017413441 /DNA_START=822 /DNA_END=1574 /DNA_ORIENTATION=+